MIVTALLLLAVQADTVSPAGPSGAKKVPDPDKVICRREVATGSNLTRKVCMPRSEWNRRMRENGGATERLRGPVQACPRGVSGCD